MVQGKFKKAKLPKDVKIKQKKKGVAFTRRSNAPIPTKKHKFNEAAKIKDTISKTVNGTAEQEIRQLANDGQIHLSKAQETVVKHTKSKATKKTE